MKSCERYGRHIGSLVKGRFPLSAADEPLMNLLPPKKRHQDMNTTGFIETGSWGMKEAKEMVAWKRWPPKLVAQYPYGG